MVSWSTLRDWYRTAHYVIGSAIIVAVMTPRRAVARKCHDNTCDECGFPIAGEPALDHFDVDDDELDDVIDLRTALATLLRADYSRYCVPCAVDQDDIELRDGVPDEILEHADEFDSFDVTEVFDAEDLSDEDVAVIGVARPDGGDAEDTTEQEESAP